MFLELTKRQIKNKIKFIRDYVTSDKNAATSSMLDANANVNNKNVATLQAEIYKDFNIQIKREMVKEYIKEMYGKKTVKDFERDLKEHIIYIHDETGSIGSPYCAAIKLDPLVEKGLQSLGGESESPKHLRSFAGSYVNAMFAMSSQFNGAIATTSILGHFDVFARKDFGDNYLETHKNEIEQELQHIVYALNQPAAARNFQSLFFNWSILDENYFKGLYENYVTPNGDKFNWESLNKLQKFFLKWINAERLKKTLTFPVITASLLEKDGEIVDKDYHEFLGDELADGNSFFIYTSNDVDSISSCCRLSNKIKTFTLTNGNIGDDTGSTQVITINFNRMVQLANVYWYKGKHNRYYTDNVVGRVQKYLLAYRRFHEFFLNNKMLTAYDSHYISMKKQYVTVGLNGVMEAAEFLGYTPGIGEDYKEWLTYTFNRIQEQNKEFGERNNILVNSEMVPAEGLGPKFYKWDKEDGFKVNPNRNSYNSYLYPVEGIDLSEIDKVILYGREVSSSMDGGSALHLNLTEHLTREGYKKLLSSIAKAGVPLTGINVPVTECRDCGKRVKRFLRKCESCGSKNLDYETRIIGYVKKITSFSAARQLEARKRFYH